MARRRKMDPERKAFISSLLEHYQPKDAQDIQEMLKDLLGDTLQSMLEAEMDEHLGYSKYDYQNKETDDSRNGYSPKTVTSTMGTINLEIPRDRQSTFQPEIVKKNQTDISNIEDQVLSMYAKGMTTRDISSHLRDVYGVEASAEMISHMTDRILPIAKEWQNRPLKRFYTFLFVDCLYVAIRKDYETKNYAVYVILGYDVDGQKDILGLWLSESESKHQWMQIFDEIKNRGVEDVLFLSMDGVSGLEEGAKAIFPHVTVQRCIVHLIRNSIKYVPTKDYKHFTAQLKKVYGAASLKAAEAEFERFRQAWNQYPGAVDVWVRNWQHVAQLFSYGSAVRKILYTTNAVESVNSSFRKVTKKGAFPNENALLKLLYLRVSELYRKWNKRPQSNWALVRNQLDIDEKIQERIRKYENGGF